MCRFDHVNIVSSGATGDDPLLNPQLSISILSSRRACASLGNVIGRNFNFVQNILQILIKRINFIYVGRVKGKAIIGLMVLKFTSMQPS
jgi:hypothetical protein